MKKSIDQLLKKYLKVLELDDFNQLMDFSMKGYKSVDIPEDEIRKLDQLLKQREEEDKRLFKTVELNNKGISYEKSGNIDKAIRCYEENILIGYRARHSFDRLMILYRKLKDYDNELRVIEKAIKIFKEQKYSDRLNKLQNIKN